MKKLLSFTISAALLTALAATVFVSCKKDLHEIAQGNSQITEKTEAQIVYERIVRFREALKAYHSDSKTDNGYVSPSEARSILDGAINYGFSDVNRYLVDTELDTLYYDAPAMDAEGNVAVNDLIDIYDRFVSAIGDDANSVNYFMILYPQTGTRDSDVKIVFTRGNNQPQPGLIPCLDYFEVGDDWIWGFDAGKCDHSVTVGDAAQELTKKCKAMFNQGRTRDDADTLTIIHTYDVDYDTKSFDELQSIVDGVDCWLFHAENLTPDEVSEYCITYNLLNLYFRNLYGAVILNTGCFHYSPDYHSPIREIIIRSEINNKNSYMDIFHSAFMTYYKIGFPN